MIGDENKFILGSQLIEFIKLVTCSGPLISFGSLNDSIGLVIANIDGIKISSQLLSLPHSHRSPSWSPDGLQIIYEGIDFDGDSEIYVINADGTGLIKLTNNSIDDVRPLWGGLR